ncbi:MAG: DUF2027 domain-containing protein [Porphyromonas sp.]|nr:DUF2027 domain-containing protein [Porphyromonas sp.]
MQQLNVGDRVRFLNTTGGGIIKRLTPDGLVYVEDESGFELPVLTNEVVMVTEGSTIVPKPTKAGGKKSAEPTKEVTPVRERIRSTEAQGELLNAYFCILPVDPDQIGQGGYEIYLINDSNYDLQLMYSSGQGAAQVLRYVGLVPFDSSEFIDEFDITEVPERSKCTAQIMAYKDGGVRFRPKAAYNIEFNLESSRFFKKNAFKPNPFFDDGAIIIELVRDDVPLRLKKIDAEALAEEMMSQKRKVDQPRRRRAQAPKRSKREPTVVDLHISELVDTTAGMGNKEILDLQLGKVEEVMKRFEKPSSKGAEIIFIHGKGEGVLRKAVTDFLQRRYPNAYLQDASFQEYGFGATKVTIK